MNNTDNTDKVIYRKNHKIVTLYFKDGTEYSSDVMKSEYIRGKYCYGILPDNKEEVYEKDVWEKLLNSQGYIEAYKGEKTFFKKRVYLPPTEIFGVRINRRIYKDELVKVTYKITYKDCSDKLPSIETLENDLGFKDYSEFVFNREQELKRMLSR